jgi:chloride channel protein, CIC family
VSERKRVLLPVFLLAGLASGLAAVAFHAWLETSHELLLARALTTSGWTRALLLVGMPAAMAAALGFVVQRFVPSAFGANLARVRRAHAQDVECLSPATVASTFALTPLSLGSGAPMGPEGPAIVITSGVSVWVGKLCGVPREMLRGLVPVGTAAGIAAIFRAPIAGVVFAVEEMIGISNRVLLCGALMAAVVATLVQRTLIRSGAGIVPTVAATWSSGAEMLGFAAVGIWAGLVSGAVLYVTPPLRARMRAWFPSIPLRFAIGGTAVGLLGWTTPSMLGIGYDTTFIFGSGGGGLAFDAAAMGAKTAGFIIAAGAGLLGGTFAPTLFIGASCGAVIGDLGVALGAPVDVGAYALVGMGAYFAGVLRAPIAGVLIVVELSGAYGLVVPLMLAAALASSISHGLAPMTLEEDQLMRERNAELLTLPDGFTTLAVPFDTRSA